MTKLSATLLVALFMAMGACAQTSARDTSIAAMGEASGRQLLVMLRATPPHFRPDLAYSRGYDAQVRQGAQRRVAEDLARHYGLSVVSAWPMPALGVDCFVMEATNPRAVPDLVAELGRDARVESAQAMNVFRVLGHNDPLYPLQPSARLWHLADLHRIATGRNVRVAEVDTGVEADHPDLRGRVAMVRNFADSPATGEAHGTAVAGIIAARADDGIGIAGIAPEAKLYALRACQQPDHAAIATCTSFTLAKALQFALDQDARVINLSLGGPRDRLLERLIDVALARNVIVVGAADPRVDGGGFPAGYPGVLAVAADASANAPPNALVAPGHDVPTTTMGQTWGFVSGSSYAAAHVSGAVALLLERAPSMDAAQVRQALAPGGNPDAALERAAAVDACSALARVTGACVCGCVVARGTISALAH